MKIANEFTVSAPIEKAWDVLIDLEQVIPLMPGAQMTGHDGDDVLGKVKVKVGPVTSEFNGKVHFVERDREQRRAVIDAKGKESRGTGNAAATVTAVLHEAGDRTRVTVDTDLKIVGKLAQFGSGMLQQVSEKLLGQFVESLEAKLATENNPENNPEDAAAATPAGTAPNVETPAARVVTAPAAAEPAPIDLLDLAGGAALKKYAPMVFAAFAAAAALFTLGRLRLARRVRRDRR
jgi:carbon monoxide dehydrogenase subunit G